MQDGKKSENFVSLGEKYLKVLIECIYGNKKSNFSARNVKWFQKLFGVFD